MHSQNKTQILEEILKAKRKELEILKQNLPLTKLKKLVSLDQTEEENSFLKGLLQKNKSDTFSVIAEVKRKSPSKGILNQSLDPVKQAQIYQRAGAAAVSVLTEKNFFQGSLEDLQAVKKAVKIPVLRKDFIFDEYQIWESKLIGADAILLIAAVLETEQIKELIEISDSLNLEVLLEIHSEEEAQRSIGLKPEMIGVNNRNLNSFEVDLNHSLQLIKKFKAELGAEIWISESGLSKQEQLKLLAEEGFGSFLIGESILRQKSPVDFLRELIQK